MNQRKLLDLFNLQKGEGKMVVLLIGLALFEGISNATARTTTYALFLTVFDAQTLPYTYIAIAVFATLVSYIYLKLTERYPLGKILIANSAFIVFLLLGLWLGETLIEGRWVAFMMPIVFGILNTLMITAYWGMIGRVFNIQQSKRLTGLIATGDTIAFMLGGFLMPFLVSWVGAVNVLLVSAITMIVAWALLYFVVRMFAAQLNIAPKTTSETPGDQKPAESVLKSNYVRLIFALFIIFIVGIYIVDNTFYALAEIKFPDADQLASFVGVFWGVSSALILVMQAFVSGRVMVRYGVGVVMMLTPVVLAIESGSMAIVGTLFGVTSILFWLAVTANLSRIILDATDQAAVNVLYQPLPTDLRTQAQTMVNGIFYPVSIGLAGVLLLLFRNVLHFSVVQITYVLFLITIVWLTVAIFLRRAYPKALIKALSRRDFGDTDYLVADASSLRILSRGLKSKNVGVVLYSLDLLEAIDPEALPAHLPDLLEHHTAEVRLEVLSRIERLELTSALPIIRDRFKYEGSAEVRGASLRTMAVLGGENIFDEIFGFLDDPDPRLRKGVLVGMLRSGELDGIVAAASRLTPNINSKNPIERDFAAQVLGEGGISGFYRPLIKLLQDEQPQVQRTALAAAAKIQHPKLWLVMVDCLSSKALRAASTTALASAGERVIPTLAHQFTREGQTRDMLISLAQVLGRIQGPEAAAVLGKRLDFPDEMVRTEILLALNKCGHQVGPEGKGNIEDQIKAELAQAAWVAACLVDLAGGEKTTLLSTSLKEILHRHRLRLLLWLSFIYNPQTIGRVQETLGISSTFRSNGDQTLGATGQQSSYALETIDVLLPTNQKSMVLPLVEGLPPDQLLQRLQPYFPQQSRSPEAWLPEVILCSEVWLTSWVKAAALYTIARLPAPHLTPLVISSLESTDPLMRESALWTLNQLDPAQTRVKSDHLGDDPSPEVAAMARQLTNAHKGDRLMLSTVEKVMALKRLSIFNDTPNEVLADVAVVLNEQKVGAGETIFEKGEIGNSVYILTEGEVHIHDGENTIARLTENDVFGEMSVLDPDVRAAAATAIQDSLLLRLDQEPFKELLTNHSEIAWRVIQILTQRLRQAQSQIRDRRDPSDLLGKLKKKLSDN